MPMHEFRKCVKKYNGACKLRKFSCWGQFLCMAFAQLTHRDSLRDIEACLRAQGNKLYHLGIRGKVSRSTLADANDARDWRIYQDFAIILLKQARKLYVDDKFSVQIENTTYALDSTIIDLLPLGFSLGKIQNVIPTAQRATISSVKRFFIEIGVTIVYFGVGSLASLYSYQTSFLLFAWLTILVGVVYNLLLLLRLL